MATYNGVIPQFLIGNVSNTDATSYAFTSTSPRAAGRVIACWFLQWKSDGAPSQPTASGTNAFSGTWNVYRSVTIGSNIRLTLLWSISQSTTAGVITVAVGAETQHAASWGVTEFVNVDTTTPFVQFKDFTDTGTTTGTTITLDNPFTASHNLAFGMVGLQANITITVGAASTDAFTGFNGGAGVSTNATDGASRAPTSFSMGTSLRWSWSSSAVNKVGCLVEVNHDGTGVNQFRNFYGAQTG